MKRVALICLSVLFVVYLLSGCVSKEEGITPSIDWSEVNIPSIGEEGNWALVPGMICGASPVFLQDGKTIYALGDSTVWRLLSSGMSFLIKSDDYGHTWSLLPALEELELHEAFNIVSTGDTLFISSTDKGIYRSIDGGQTFDKLLPVPGLEEGRAMIWDLDATIDASGKPVILAATYYSRGLGGLWMLSYPYDTWVDLRVGNTESGTKCQVLSIAFSPNYAEDKQIIAATSDLQHLCLTMKYDDEDWGERIADAYIPDAETNCDLEMVGFAFPDDYDSQNPVVYIGIGLWTEHLYQTPQYTDLYRIDGKPAGSGPSIATDLDVGGKGTNTAIYGVLVKGAANSGTILAGSIGQVYRSTDGGKSWQGAHKPPTGGVIGLTCGHSTDEGSLVYCISTDFWGVLVPRGAEVPVGETAFSCSVDGGITWNQLSLISTTIDETISRAVSPNYAKDKTLFMLTRSSSTLTVSLDEDEAVNITREPDNPGVNAEAIVVVHGSNPPSERMKIGDRDHVAGTGAKLLLDDECPSVSLKVLPVLEKPGWLETIKEFYPPKLVEQYLALCEQPRQAAIYVLDGLVTVTKGEAIEAPISVDGDASDWQGIEPLVTDSEGDAPSKDKDMKALYATNDGEYLYFMVEFYGENPHSACQLCIDTNLDGEEDYFILVKQQKHLQVHTYPQGKETFIGEGKVSLGNVLEEAIPLKLIGNPKKVRITDIRIITDTDGHLTFPDICEGSLEVELKGLVAPTGTPVPFPSTESLWKTTDGGTTWERILTSNLKLWVDGEEIQVGPLESITLSDNFAQDNTLFVYEGGDKPKVWVSTDGGVTFAPQE